MYPFQFVALPDKEALLRAYKNKKLNELPTPSVVIDRAVFQENCEKMLANAERLKVDFRPHIKTHKTLEGARLQLSLIHI